MIISDTDIKEPILQNLVPVLTEDGVLRGMIQTGVREWQGQLATLEFPTRTITLTAKRFQNEKVSRELMCAIFPVNLSQSKQPWNGIPGFLSAVTMGYFSVWAIPVLNPDYNRTSIGLLSLFNSNKLDPSTKETISAPVDPSTVQSKPPVVLKATVSVSVYRFKKRLAFVEFNWVDIFLRKLEAEGLEKEQCFLTVQTLQSPTAFKTICYNSTNSSSVPFILQIMRISRNMPEAGTYDFVLEVVGKGHYLFNISLVLKP